MEVVEGIWLELTFSLQQIGTTIPSSMSLIQTNESYDDNHVIKNDYEILPPVKLKIIKLVP